MPCATQCSVVRGFVIIFCPSMSPGGARSGAMSALQPTKQLCHTAHDGRNDKLVGVLLEASTSGRNRNTRNARRTRDIKNVKGIREIVPMMTSILLLPGSFHWCLFKGKKMEKNCSGWRTSSSACEAYRFLYVSLISLSSHRYSYIVFVFSSRFNDS